MTSSPSNLAVPTDTAMTTDRSRTGRKRNEDAMPEYDKKNTGVLFKNDRKSQDKHPDYSGSYTDGDGREFFLDAWIREGSKGKFMSLRTKLKQKSQSKPEPAQEPAAEGDAPF